jgi:hypothetical protein
LHKQCDEDEGQEHSAASNPIVHALVQCEFVVEPTPSSDWFGGTCSQPLLDARRGLYALSIFQVHPRVCALSLDTIAGMG